MILEFSWHPYLFPSNKWDHNTVVDAPYINELVPPTSWTIRARCLTSFICYLTRPTTWSPELNFYWDQGIGSLMLFTFTRNILIFFWAYFQKLVSEEPLRSPGWLWMVRLFLVSHNYMWETKHRCTIWSRPGFSDGVTTRCYNFYISVFSLSIY